MDALFDDGGPKKSQLFTMWLYQGMLEREMARAALFLESGELLPMPRGIPLKNTSIEAIIAFDPAAPLGPTYPKTRKGRVRHLRPDAESQRRQHETARPRWLVFPKYRAGAVEELQPLDRVEAFRQLAFNCFNYKLLGETAFRAIGGIVREVDCYTFTFSDLDRAVPMLSALAES